MIVQTPGATDADIDLMQRILRTFGATLGPVATATTYPIPSQFLAALVANESGGNPNAKRFEPAVFVSIWKVLLGRATDFQRISKPQFMRFVDPSTLDVAGRVPANVANSLQRLDGIATSWGLTQIMGYHTVRLVDAPGWRSIEQLQTVMGNLQFAALLLTDFMKQYHLDPLKNPDKLFRCWNSGHPDGTTTDPAYVPNGIVRMNIFSELAAAK